MIAALRGMVTLYQRGRGRDSRGPAAHIAAEPVEDPLVQPARAPQLVSALGAFEVKAGIVEGGGERVGDGVADE